MIFSPPLRRSHSIHNVGSADIIENPKHTDNMITKEEEIKLQILRQQWKENPDKRKEIEEEARKLQETPIIKPSPLNSLKEWDYVTLELLSYKRFIHRIWHEYFVKHGLVKRNFFGQFIPVQENIARFCEWMTLYDDWMKAKDFPNNNFLTPEQAKMVTLLTV